MDNSGNDFSKIIEKLMADEKFGEIVAAVKGAAADDAPTTSAVAEAPKISPDMLSKLPQIMEMLSPPNGKSEAKGGIVGISDKKKLLQALRPFLGEHRREAIDNIVSIAGIADLFGI